MIVVARFTVEPGGADGFRERAATALRALAACAGFRGGRLGRATDDGARWVLVTEWDGVGAYRRALGAYDVKLHATPLLARAVDEPSAYEVLFDTASGGEPVEGDRARDADTAGPGGAAPPRH